MDADETYMRRALDLAAKGRGRTSPNPMVGCVVVRNGDVVSEGFHEMAGGPHAEVNALRAAGDVSDATVYVSLEPCCHHGKTPPCVDLLREKRPKRLVAAMEDPNPRVSGQGIAALRDAGVDVTVGVLESEARRLNEAFIKYVTTGLPFVIAKVGMSLDGKIATRAGHSKWVTSEASRIKVHELRDAVDAILVGSRTVMLDDPSLTTRLPDRVGKDPVRVILDSEDYLDTNCKVFRNESNAPTWVAVAEARDVPCAAEVLTVGTRESGLDLMELMRHLGQREIVSVLIEGGGTTHASAFEAGVVDKVMFFIAPKIVGGRDAISAVEGEGVELMSDAVELTDMTVSKVGPDLLVEAYVKKS